MGKVNGKLALGALLIGAFAAVGCGDDNRDSFNDVTLLPTSTATLTTTTSTTSSTPGVVPSAANDTFSIVGNGRLSVAAAQGVLANDQAQGASPTVVTSPSRGALTLNADGSFTYTPNQGVGNTTDSFTYQLSNAAGSATGTVTINIGALAFFVNNQAAAGGNGQQATPFRTLAEAQAAATGVAGAQITVARGDGTSTGYNTPVILAAGQSLVGQDAASQPVLSAGVTLAGGNRVANLRFSGVTGVALNGTGAQDGTISGVTVQNSTGTSISLVNATGTWSLDGCTVTNPGSDGIDGSSGTGTLTWTVTNSSFSGGPGGIRAAIVSLITATASQTLTVSGCSFGGLNGSEAVAFGPQATGTSSKLTMTNNNVTGGGATLRGLEVATRSTSNFLGIITGNTITGCTAEGIQISLADNSIARARFTGNRLTGNETNNGLNIAHISGSPSFGGVFTNNTSDSFNLAQNGLGTFQVEQLSQFNGSSGNAGSPSTAGTIQDVPAGSLNIPNS